MRRGIECRTILSFERWDFKLPFVHLQVQTGYSLLNSAIKLEKLIEYSRELKFKALAITDFHVMYGAVEFYKSCTQNGIKPIIGLIASVRENDEEQQAFPIVLLAKNNEGYQNLLKISSVLQTKASGGIPEKWLESYSAGLIAITAGKNGEIERNIMNGNREKAAQIAEKYKHIFEDNSFYIAIQNHFEKEDEMLTSELIALSKQLNVPLVATNDVKYINREDMYAYTCLQAIKDNKKVEDNEEIMQTDEYYLKSSEEMEKLFNHVPEAIQNSLDIAEKCNVTLELGKAHLPAYPTPDELHADEYLEKICLEGLRERFQNPTEQYLERLTYELSVIKKMKFSDYFLIVWDFMKYAHEHQISTGPGRGSAAGSLVSYVLKITNVDPIQHHLLFERFLNPERITMPDIDIDFPDTRRDEVIEYVANKYGKLHVAQIITFGTFAAKAAVRDIARVLGASSEELDFLAKKIPSRLGITLSDALIESAPLKQAINENKLYKKIYEIALKIEGMPRHTSTHAAGVVFSEEPLTDVVPIQESASGIYLTQFSMDYLEDLGLLKMDFLGLRNLTIIDSIKKMMGQAGKHVDLNKISYSDEKTFQLLSEGDTTGIFQLESDGMRNVLRNLKPTSFEDIVAVNALYRPGPMENIPLYINRKHGQASISYIHPHLKSILYSTYGVIIYQEQIMEIAARMAGFSLGEADLLRRAVGKKKREVLDKERNHFVSGCLNKGYDERIANEVYDLIVKFANYGFNRSHAVAYSMISYQLAYLKAHYPIYFMAALLTSVIGNDEKVGQYIREAKQKNLVILPPSINKSGYPFQVENSAIRCSLAIIKNVGVAAIKEIFHIRQQKEFTDLFDFCVRVSTKAVNRRTIESLVYSGAMDEFQMDRAVLEATIDSALGRADDKQQINTYFVEAGLTLKLDYANVAPMKVSDKLKHEKDALGFYFSSHPAAALRSLFESLGTVPIRELNNHTGKKIKIGAIITSIKTIRTKKGEQMAFFVLSDETNDCEAVVFPNEFNRISGQLEEGLTALFEGKAEKRNGRLQMIIQKIIDYGELEKVQPEGKLFLKVDEQAKELNKLYEIKEIIKQYRGTTPVYIYYEQEKKTVQLPNNFFVNVTEKSLSQFKEILGEEYVVFRA